MDREINLLATASPSISYNSVLGISLVFLLGSIICYQSGIDLWLADSIYRLEGGDGGHFPLAKNYWLSQVLHEGGRALVQAMFFTSLALLLGSWFIDGLKPYRQALVFVVVATAWVTSCVASLKHATTLPCPSALKGFGGERDWTSFWQLFAPDLPTGNCYPAGHASAGYAWLAIAFLAPAGSPKFYLLLLPGIVLGLSFGIAQQLRGAHFLSHDLATIALSWFLCGSTYHLMRPLYLRTGRNAAAPQRPQEG